MRLIQESNKVASLDKVTATGVAYTVLGNGVTLVAVHGGPGTDHQLFSPYLDPLADKHRLVYLDLPGHGASQPTQDFSLTSMAAAVQEVIEAVSSTRVYLLGSSYGSFLSLLVALLYPHKVKGLVLVGAAASHGFRRDSLAYAKRHASAKMLSALEALWNDSIKSNEDFHMAWREIFPLYFHILPSAEIYRLADALSYSIVTRKAILPTLSTYDLRNRLSEVQIPILITAGRHDWITSVRQAEGLAAGLGQSTLEVFENTGHYPFIEDTTRFLCLLQDWLENIEKRGSA